jgi:nicotinate phosphoribosyltransferase
MGINPATKSIIFSDGLNVDKAIELNEYCKGKIGCSFGIGTNLTCDIREVKPLNIVMKLYQIKEVNAISTK